MKKKKFKINNKSSQKYLWIVDWAKENKKLNENFDIAYEMLSKPKQKKLDKILE